MLRARLALMVFQSAKNGSPSSVMPSASMVPISTVSAFSQRTYSVSAAVHFVEWSAAQNVETKPSASDWARLGTFSFFGCLFEALEGCGFLAGFLFGFLCHWSPGTCGFYASDAYTP